MGLHSAEDQAGNEGVVFPVGTCGTDVAAGGGLWWALMLPVS